MRIFQVVAMIAAITVAVLGLHPTSSAPPATQAAAESFASAGTAAFAETELASNPDLTAAQRSAGIPTDPVASWDIPTNDGRDVQLVLPAGLGAGQVTSGGQVVYPDRGAGFEVMAENTGTSRRTITRIPSAPAPLVSGAQPLPVVTMFVRIPVDTVMFARTDGVLTVNDTTPAKKPIAAIAPAAARDARGAVVPSGFVTTQIKPGLYLLAQVIKPAPDTAFPVYADPAWLDSVVDTVVSASNTAVNFVKANPVESIEIAAGGVMVATGVGTGFGVGLIADGATSLVQKAGEATGNTGLQALGGGMEVLGYLSPTNALKKGLTNIAEREIEQLGKKELDDVAAGALGHADDVTVIKPVTPSAPTKLPDTAAAKPADLPTTPGVDTPKIPTGPPAKLPYYEGPNGPRSLPKGCELDCGHTTEVPVGVYDEAEMPGHFNANLDTTAAGRAPEVFERTTSAQGARNRYQAQKGHPRVGADGNVLHEWSPASSTRGGSGADIHVLPQTESNIERDIFKSVYSRQGVKVGDQFSTAYRATDGQTRCIPCAIDHRETQGLHQLRRPSSPSEQRFAQAIQTQGATNQQRNDARESAQRNNQSTETQRNGNNNPGSNKRGSRSSQQKKNKKQSTKHKQRKGQR